jgi:hypothetical protein
MLATSPPAVYLIFHRGKGVMMPPFQHPMQQRPP